MQECLLSWSPLVTFIPNTSYLPLSHMALWVHPPRSWWPRHSTAWENLRSDKIYVNVHIMHSRMRQKSYRESWRAQEGKHCANSTPKPSLEGCEAVQMSSAAEDQQVSSRAEHQETWVLLPTPPLVTQVNPRRVLCVYCASWPLCAFLLCRDYRRQDMCPSSVYVKHPSAQQAPTGGTAVLNKQQ